MWRVLTDFRPYTTWNPYIYPASGEAVAGSHLDLTLHDGQQIHFWPAVVEGVPDEKLIWMDRLPLGVLERILTWRIIPLDADHAHVVASELFQGVALPHFSGLPATPPLRASLPSAPNTANASGPPTAPTVGSSNH